MRLEAEFFICGSTYILLSEHGVETNRGFLGNSLSWNLGFYFSPSTSNILICGLPNNTDSDHESPIPDHMGYEICSVSSYNHVLRNTGWEIIFSLID